jgi:hypothetical protein
VLAGNRALAMAGDVDMGSSSGEGDREAFLFRDDDGLDTARRSAEGPSWEMLQAEEKIVEAGQRLYLWNLLVLLGERRLSWK